MPIEKKELERLTDKILDEIADKIFSLSQENLTNNGTLDTGLILYSANVNRKHLEKEIVFPVPYSAAIEYGSEPHRIYSGWLEPWVMRKLKVPKPQAKKVAYAIAQKIARDGTEPQPFVRPAIDEVIMRKW